MTDDFEHRLRDMMRAQSGHAPDDYPVVQNVLRDVANRPSVPQYQSRWRTWLVPLVAAGAVAVVAAAIVGVQNFHPSAHDKVGVGSTDSPTPSNPVVPDPGPTDSAPTTQPVSPPAPLGLDNFRVGDLTWVGDDGWALGSATCLKGSGTCIAMARTTNGGATWKSLPTPPANLADPINGCNDTCIGHIRFATDQIGYAYGVSGFFVTTDGGANWKPQGDGQVQTLALETLDGNVIRVQAKCLPGCPVTVQTASIGGGEWTARNLPGDQPGKTSGATLVRVAGHAYLDVHGSPASGAGNAMSRLFVSADDGSTWTNMGEPCPQTGGGPAGSEVDSTNIAAGGGTFAVLCTPRGVTESTVRASADDGASYRSTGESIGDTAGMPLAVSGRTILLVAGNDLWRSTNGGDTWTASHDPRLGAARWLGFENLTDARLVSADGRAIWTTHDAGATWTQVTFP